MVRQPHRSETIRRFLRSRSGPWGLAIFLVLVLVAVLADLVAPYGAQDQVGESLSGPSWAHPFGTDELGRDLLSRTIFAARSALIIAVGSALGGGILGVPLGIVAGYLGRWIDSLTMRMVDVALALPSILLALIIVTILGPSTVNLLIALALGAVPIFARLARAGTIAVRDREYVLAARGFGAGKLDIMARTIFPNVLPPILVQLVVTASVAVVAAAGLSFLGLGQPPPEPTWGNMLQTSRTFLYHNPWYGVFPGLAIVLATLAFDGIGRGLERALGAGASSRSRAGAVA